VTAETFGLYAIFLHDAPDAWPSEIFRRRALGTRFYANVAEMCMNRARINAFQFAGNTLHKLEARKGVKFR
jgi:hypothetical protein